LGILILPVETKLKKFDHASLNDTAPNATRSIYFVKHFVIVVS